MFASVVYAKRYKTNPLYDAIKKNNWSQFRKYANKRYFYRGDYRMGEDILTRHAFRYKRYRMVEYLLKKGYNVNKTNYANGTLLYYTAGACDLKGIKLLLKYGANVNISRDGGYSPLHMAATCGSSTILKLLIKKGARINVKDVGGSTPIDYAAGKKRLHNIKALLRAGSKYHSSLMNAVGAGDPKSVRFLTTHNRNVKRLFRKKGVYFWNKWWYEMRDKRYQKKVADILISKGLKITYMLEKLPGYAPVSNSLVCGNSKMLDNFIRKGLPVNSRYKGKDTSLILAACNVRMIKHLRRKGAKVNRRKWSQLLLNIGAYKNKRLTSYVLRKGANINSKDSQGRTILYFSAGKGKSQSYMKFLLRKGINVNSRDKNGNTFVHYWLQHGCNSDHIKLMLKYGFKKSIRNYRGQTALAVAKRRCSATYKRKKYVRAVTLLSGKSGREIASSLKDLEGAKSIGWKKYSGKERNIRPYSFTMRRRNYKKFNWKLIIKPEYGFKYVTIYVADKGKYYRKINKSEYVKVYSGKQTVFDAGKYFKKYKKYRMLYIYLNGNKYSKRIKPVRAKFYVKFN